MVDRSEVLAVLKTGPTVNVAESQGVPRVVAILAVVHNAVTVADVGVQEDQVEAHVVEIESLSPMELSARLNPSRFPMRCKRVMSPCVPLAI